MKSIGKIKLNQLSKVELEQREMNALRGGNMAPACATCACTNSDNPLSSGGNEKKGTLPPDYK